MQKWAHVVGTIALGALGLSNPTVQAAAGHHPAGTIIGVAAWTIIGNLLPPPWNLLARLWAK